MRWRCRIIMFCMAAAASLAASQSSVAGQPDGGIDLSGAAPGLPSAESGKPVIGGPPGATPGVGGNSQCTPFLPCGTRLLGSVRKNGAVELQVPALRW